MQNHTLSNNVCLNKQLYFYVENNRDSQTSHPIFTKLAINRKRFQLID